MEGKMTGTLVKARTRQEHVRLIAAAWQKGVESIIESGECLCRAKAELPHGSYEAMIQSELPFGPTTARRLVIIASNNILSNRAHVHALPPSWGTLYELTKLPQTLLLEKIEDGTITPDLERRDVRALLPPPEQRDDDLPDHEGSNAPSPEDGAAAPATNPLVVLWATTGPEERRAFVRACWNEIVRVHDQADPAKPNGNAGADHWAHLSKENAEAVDRWVESDT
jgi:hypothetical protein